MQACHCFVFLVAVPFSCNFLLAVLCVARASAERTHLETTEDKNDCTKTRRILSPWRRWGTFASTKYYSMNNNDIYCFLRTRPTLCGDNIYLSSAWDDCTVIVSIFGVPRASREYIRYAHSSPFRVIRGKCKLHSSKVVKASNESLLDQVFADIFVHTLFCFESSKSGNQHLYMRPSTEFIPKSEWCCISWALQSPYWFYVEYLWFIVGARSAEPPQTHIHSTDYANIRISLQLNSCHFSLQRLLPLLTVFTILANDDNAMIIITIMRECVCVCVRIALCFPLTTANAINFFRCIISHRSLVSRVSVPTLVAPR